MIIDFAELSSNQVYHTMTQTLVPRPIAWVLTQNEDGAGLNLAPFSYFAAVSSDPALLMISIGKKDAHTPKDTRRNILHNKRFVVHIASHSHARSMNNTSATLDYGVSEIEAEGLALAEFHGFGLPRLAGAKVAFGCELYESMQLGGAPQELIFGRVTQVYIDDAIASDTNGRLSVDASLLDPLARLGGSEYWAGGHVERIKRPE